MLSPVVRIISHYLPSLSIFVVQLWLNIWLPHHFCKFEGKIMFFSFLNQMYPTMTSIYNPIHPCYKVLERQFGSPGYLRLPLHSYFTSHLDSELRIAARLHMKKHRETTKGK